MEELEKLRQWLLSYPDWGGGDLTVDYTHGNPGSAGLFPVGLEEVSRRTDVQGNTLIRNRLHFLLHRIAAGSADGTNQAAWLIGLQKWVQQQSILGKLPQLGCLPEQVTARAYEGKLLRVDTPGTRVYQLRLFIEFYTYQEGWVDDGSGV